MIEGICRAASCLLLILATSAAAEQHKSEPVGLTGDHSTIASFNKAFADAIRAMDNEAVLSLWEENGIALLPNAAPVRGKTDMRKMLQGISSDHPKAKMQSFTNECFDVERSGSWASEWCLEHQIVSERGKPTFDSWGKMLLVLHRQPSGAWRLSREMWNQASPSDSPSAERERHRQN